MQNYKIFHSTDELYDQVKKKLLRPGMLELLNKTQHLSLPYFHHSEIKYRLKDFIPEAVPFEDFWTVLRYSRIIKASLLNPFDTENPADQFTYFETERIKKFSHEITLSGGGTLIQGKKTLDQCTYIRLKAFRTEAINSAILEGAHTTPRRGEELLLGDGVPLDESEQMVVNNHRAMKFIKDNLDIELSKDFLLELHRIVLEGTADNESWAGSFRKNGEEVSVINDSSNEVLHHGTSSDILASYLANFIIWVNDSKQFFQPLLKAIIIHFLYGYLHPHMDGNGRMARLLFYWFALKSDYWVFEYLPISSRILSSRARYRDSFLKVESDLNDLTYFIEDQLEIINDSYLIYVKELEARENFMKEFGKFIKTLNSRQATLVLSLIDDNTKTFTVQQHANYHDVSITVARDDLNDLVRRDILETEKVGKRFLYRSKSGNNSLFPAG